MSSAHGWKTLAPAGLALATLLLNLGAFLAVTSMTGPLMTGTIIGFSDSHDRRAFHILEHSSTPAALADATAEVQRALDLAPYNNAARLRLMYIDTLRGNSLSPAGRRLLAESYELAPFDHTVAAWRVGFSLEHWERLTPELRKSVEAEAMAFAEWRSQDANVFQVLQNVRNPAGRVSAALWLQTLKH